MTLIKNTDQLKNHVSINFNFTWEVVNPFVKQAERQYIKSILGSVLYLKWAVAPTEEKEKEAYDLFVEASANLAMLKFIPQNNVSVSDSGIQVSSNEFSKPAEWWQIRDLQRAYEANGLMAIDEALEIMESDETTFSDWVGTPGYTVFKELYTPKTQDFQRYFNINNSRRTFLALRPYILESQEQLFNWLDPVTLETVTDAGDEIAKKALEYMRGGQVNHTVAKAASSGVFLLKSSGMFVRSEEASLANTKLDKLSEEELYRLKNDRITAGDEYLKKLKEFILANPSTFPEFEKGGNDAPLFVHNTKSIVAF